MIVVVLDVRNLSLPRNHRSMGGRTLVFASHLTEFGCESSTSMYQRKRIQCLPDSHG